MKVVKPLVFILALVPFGYLLWLVLENDLGANPVEKVSHYTGDWTLRFLLLTLAISPLKNWFSLPVLIRFRRMLGLFTFFYACLHFLTWLWLDLELQWLNVGADIVKRPYITVGFSAFFLMSLLAITSNKGMMRYLGQRWKSLHRSIYLIGLLAILHYIWLVKADLFEPIVYALIFVGLMIARLPAIKISQIGFRKLLS